MNLPEVILAIKSGSLDESLDYIIQAVRDRRLTNRPSMSSFRVGDHVRLNDKVRPAYLIGNTATILKTNRTRVTIEFHDGQNLGRFHKTTNCPLTLLTVMQPTASTTFRKRTRRQLDAH